MTEPAPIPNATPFDLIIESVEDLMLEARNYADGEAITNQAQADEVSRIIDGLNKNAKALDDTRIIEKAPLDQQIKTIQDRYNIWIADRKNKTPGKVWKAVDALKATLQPFLAEQDRIKREAEEKARAEAGAAQRAAQEAMRAAEASNLAAREEAEKVFKAAEEAARVAKAASKDKAHATGGARAMGLRSVWKAELTDERAAARHFWKRNPAAFTALLQNLAEDEVRQGKRDGVPGVRIYEERVL